MSEPITSTTHVHEDNRCCFCGIEDDHECIMCPDYDGGAAMGIRVNEEQNTQADRASFPSPALVWRDPVKEKPPMQRFVSGQGWQPSAKPYVLAVDVKGRMSVGYATEHSGERGYCWTFAKPIGEPTHWMPLPDPPKENK